MNAWKKIQCLKFELGATKIYNIQIYNANLARFHLVSGYGHTLLICCHCRCHFHEKQ